MTQYDDKIQSFSNLLSSFKINYTEVTLKEELFFDIYDVKLEIGTKYAKLEKILPDIALYLECGSIPRGYPVFSSGVYRVEIQTKPLPVKKFKQIFSVDKSMYSQVSLGIDRHSNILTFDLNKLPNLLIGGMPGSGKSMLLHSIILSMCALKSDIYLIDPKYVEFSIYSKISNVKAILHTADDVSKQLSALKDIMNERFIHLKNYKCRDVKEYNSKYKSGLNPIVIVIDEWADLIMSDKSLDGKLANIAQKGRAAGISVVLATQRPSSNVISGLIKANFAGRIAMRVATPLESRIVLDVSGAEKIFNVGEGLFVNQFMTEPMLFKTPLIKDVRTVLKNVPEINQSISFWNNLWL